GAASSGLRSAATREGGASERREASGRGGAERYPKPFPHPFTRVAGAGRIPGMATRRQLLLGGASVAGAAALSPLIGTGDGAAAPGRSAAIHRDLPAPGASGIDHIVVLCMEYRSFDHILGSLPGANCSQAAIAF